MKKGLAAAWAFWLVFSLSACGTPETPSTEQEASTLSVTAPTSSAAVQEGKETDGPTQAESTAPKGEESGEPQDAGQQIRVQDDNGNTVVFALNESAAAQDLFQQLPLVVEVENFSNNEKIFYPEKLDVHDTPVADVAVGTLAYYEPWGDVVMFYGEYNPNNALYELGHAVSGGDSISSLSGTVRIEPVD